MPHQARSLARLADYEQAERMPEVAPHVLEFRQHTVELARTGDAPIAKIELHGCGCGATADAGRGGSAVLTRIVVVDAVTER